VSLAGRATPEGTRAFAQKHADLASDFYSEAQGLTVSSLGLGTYLGEEDAATDRSYEEAIKAALDGGVNHLDTAVNYRGMASERALGRALAAACKSGLPRESVIVATKGGYVPHDVHDPSRGGRALIDALLRDKKIVKDDLAKGSHCLAPRYMEHMLATSLSNLALGAIDIYYLHNPEAQLSAGVDKETFYKRCRAAFEVLEDARRKGTVVSYGTATWNGYRRPLGSSDALELERMVDAAKKAAGSDDHGFRWVQLPVNLSMMEAIVRPTQKVGNESLPLLDAARKLGVSVATSGSIAQAELAHGLPGAAARAAWPRELGTSAQRAIQFVRSAPGVSVSLVGMSRKAHVVENLAVARVPRLDAASMKTLAR
jgi:aryl-alcohol dehydrogenase-like predicted oxidoreductase